MEKKREIGVRELLERWGLRVCGGTLKSPYRVSTGGEEGVDDDLRLVAFVEATEGFSRAKPVLLHRFARGEAPESFTWRRPGEDFRRALIRLGWFDMVGLPERRVARKVLEEFEDRLANRVRGEPFYV